MYLGDEINKVCDKKQGEIKGKTNISGVGAFGVKCM
jgi:hypothetical protein